MLTQSRAFLVALFISLTLAACVHDEAREEGRTNGGYLDRDVHLPPASNLTPADIAKLKWIEGTWRGMDGDKPFYERYKVEDTAMIVETLNEDGSVEGEPDRFELKNGEFGKGEGDKRSAASEISDDSITFYPAVPGKGNSFQFVRRPHGWDAILEWPSTPDKPSRVKTYKMEPWQPKK